MKEEEIIEKASDLLHPIEYSPDDKGYYIRKNGEDMGETFCRNCIDEQVKIAKKEHKQARQKILEDFDTLAKTGLWRGKKLDKEYSEKEIRRSKCYNLKEYPAKVKFEIDCCDPDFAGGNTEPRCCDSCGEYFHTNFVPDAEYANLLLEYFGDGKDLSPKLKWELDIAFYNYDYAKKEVQNILIQIAKKLINNQ